MIPCRDPHPTQEPAVPALTEREIEIVTALARGSGNKQIARSLSISEKTVRNHISNIYRKPRFRNR